MPIIYTKADDEVLEIVREMRAAHHPELDEAEVTVDCYFATEVKLHGYECAAKVKKNSYAERVQGKPDATIFLSEDMWKDASDERRAALIDHELNHLEVQWAGTDTAGKKVAKTDDLGRPKLAMRMHDHQFGWFNAIAERHGDASYEVKQAKAFADENGQTYFGWSKPPANGPEAPVKNSGKNVTTADGRKITADEMMGEIATKFA